MSATRNPVSFNLEPATLNSYVPLWQEIARMPAKPGESTSRRSRRKPKAKSAPKAAKAPRKDTAVKRTITEDVYQALKKDIITCRHKPGAVLKEEALADRYGSSRVPVREACGRLQQEGLLNVVPYKGYSVSQVSLKDIADYFDMRMLLETCAIGRAVEHANEEQIAQLKELAEYEYIYHDWSSYLRFLEHNRAFHVAIARMSGNNKLARVLDDLLEQMQRFFFLGLDMGDFGYEMRQEHELLARVIAAGPKDEAVNFLRTQVERSRERILKALITQGANVSIS